MIKYTTISEQNFDEFWNNVWSSDEFKNSLNHPFFVQLKNELRKYPFFIFNYTHDKQYYHLTSHLRVIAKRNYSNPIIQDLYYLHELSHCVEFHGEDFSSFDEWSNHLDNNELYASLISEAFVYFFIPSIRDKTFNPLWVNSFISPSVDNFSGCDFKQWNMMSFSNLQDWPPIMQHIIQQRLNLRGQQISDNTPEAEKSIIQYNLPRKNWLPLWQPHFSKINALLSSFKKDLISSQQYIKTLIDNSDSYDRPFFPTK